MPTEASVSRAAAPVGLDFTAILRDCLTCAVIGFDDQRKITACNAQAESLLGLEAGKSFGKSMDTLPAPVQPFIFESISTGRAFVDRNLLLHDDARGDIPIQLSTTPIKAGNKITGAILVLNDVSPARKFETDMIRLDRLSSVGTLSASMAHEVKNAFVAVKTFVDLLLEQNKQADLAEIVRLEMSRIDTILAQMRRFSGPAKPQFAKVQLHAVMDKSLQLIQHLLHDRKMRVTKTFRATNDALNGDQDQLEQAFINLFFNALEAMKANGRLTVTTENLPAGAKAPDISATAGPLVHVTIQDTGSGISHENMERMFEPFFTTKSDGTGLGLAITRRIIQEHSGAIEVQSEVGKGTAFNLFLPVNG